MDCPSEENLIRMRLDDYPSIVKMEFEIPDRKLTIYHEEDENELLESLETLSLDSKIVESVETDEIVVSDKKLQSKLLWQVLIINFSFFIIEIVFGLLSKSMGLVADSLDMLSDSFVYALSLFAVGAVVSRKKKVALYSGYIQITLALIGFVEVVRRFVFETDVPDYRMMIVVSIFALIANALCLVLLQKSKSNEAHMKASMILRAMILSLMLEL